MNNQKLTKLELYWYIIGGTIGSGIFFCVPLTIGYAGKAAPLAIIAATIIVYFAAIYGTVISSFFPLRGGDYSQVAFMTPPVINGVYAMIWLVSSLSISSYASVALTYLSALLPGITPYIRPLTVLITVAFFAMNYFGAKAGAKIESLMTVFLIVALAAFAVFGAVKADIPEYLAGVNFDCGFGGFSAAIGMSVWAVQGASMVGVGYAAEVDKPTKTIPISILIGTIAVSLLTIGVTFAACATLPIEDVVAAGDLTVVASQIFPGWGYVLFVIFGAVFALLTTLHASAGMMRYPMMQMADEGWLPPVFKKTTKNGWPIVSMLTVLGISVIPVIFDFTLDTIIGLTTLPMYVLYITVSIQLFTLPKRYPIQWKHSVLHMPLPLYYFLCALAVLCSGYIAGCYIITMDMPTLVGVVVLLAVLFLYSGFCLKTKRVDPAYIQSQKAEILKEIEAYEIAD